MRIFKKRTSDKIISRMKELRKEKIPYSEIARRLHVSAPVVRYHLVKKYKEQTKLRGKKKIKPTNKEYMREYMNYRYNTDPKFRKKQIKRAIEYKKKHG